MVNAIVRKRFTDNNRRPGAGLGELVGAKWPQGWPTGGPNRLPEGRLELAFEAAKWPQEGPRGHQKRHKTVYDETLKIDDPLNENA